MKVKAKDSQVGKRYERSNGVLWVILGGLGVVIIGLVIGIVVVKINRDKEPEVMNGLDPISTERYYEEHDWELTGSELALIITNTILDKLEDGSGYSVEDAKNDFASELAAADDEQTRMNLAYSFSDFMFGQGDIYSAVEILTSNEKSFVWDSDKISYYTKLMSYYEALGDVVTAEMCSNAIDEITSNWGVPPEMNSEGQPYE